VTETTYFNDDSCGVSETNSKLSLLTCNTAKTLVDVVGTTPVEQAMCNADALICYAEVKPASGSTIN